MRKKIILAAVAMAVLVMAATPSPLPAQRDYDRDRDGRYRYDRYDRHDGDRGGPRRGGLLPDGIDRTEVTDARGILRSVVIAVEAAVNTGGFDNLVDQLVEADRERIGNYPNQKFDDLEDAIRRFQRAWDQRYDTRLDVRSFARPLFRDFAYIEQGEIDRPRELRDWPLDPTRYNRVPKTHPRREDRDSTNLNRGRDVAVLVIAPREGAPRLTVSMIQEHSGEWTIDIPDDLRGPELRRNLVRHILELVDMRDRWPQDRDRAYQMVAHHILLAVYGVRADRR